MILSPLFVFWLIVIGIVVTTGVSRVRPGQAAATAVLALLLPGIVWLLLWWQLPQTAVFLPAWPANSNTGIAWLIDTQTWMLTSLLFLLAIACFSSHIFEPVISLPLLLGQQIMLLGSFLLIWSETLAGTAGGSMVLILGWGLATFPSQLNDIMLAGWQKRVGWLLLGLSFLWLAALMIPPDLAQMRVLGKWPQAASVCVLAMGLFWLGPWPLHHWRWPVGTSIPLFVRLIPSLAGGGVLLYVTEYSQINNTYALFLTTIALLGIMVGLYRAWADERTPVSMLSALLLVQTGLIVLAVVWSDGDSLIAELRTLALGFGALYLMAKRPFPAAPRWLTIVPGLAALALAGGPFLSGFAGRVALYGAWISEGYLLLALLTAGLHIPLVTTLLVIVWPVEIIAVAGSGPVAPNQLGWWSSSLVGLLVMGMLTPLGIRIVGNNNNSLLWLLLLFPLVGGALLYRGLDRVHMPAQALQQALRLPQFEWDWQRPIRLVGHQLGQAVRDAGLILAGEGGLLWLLVIFLLILLIR